MTAIDVEHNIDTRDAMTFEAINSLAVGRRIGAHLLRVLLIVSTLWTTTGMAQQRPSKEDDRRAKALFLEAERHYAAARYQQAAKSYLEAYRLSKRPELLFNLGNTHERMGQHAQAARYLRRYLESQDAIAPGAIRSRIRALEKQASASSQSMGSAPVINQSVETKPEAPTSQKSTRPSRAPMTDKPSQPKPEIPTPQNPQISDRPAGSSNIPAYILLGSGGAVLAGSLAIGLLANSAGTEGERLCNGSLCRSEASSDLDRQRSLALTSDIMLGVGAATAIVGAVWLVRNLFAGGRQQSPRASAHSKAPRSSMVPSLGLEFVPLTVRSGSGVGLCGRF